MTDHKELEELEARVDAVCEQAVTSREDAMAQIEALIVEVKKIQRSVQARYGRTYKTAPFFWKMYARRAGARQYIKMLAWRERPAHNDNWPL